MFHRFYALLACAVLVTSCVVGCAVAPSHPSVTGLMPLVPVRTYVADWDGNGGYQISPDGKKMSWFARSGLGPGLFVKNLPNGSERLVFKGLTGVTWSEDSQRLLLTMAYGGNERYHVYEVNLADSTSVPKDLTPFAGSNSYVHSTIKDSADLLIASNKRDAKVFDLYRFHHATGELALLAQNPGDVQYWATDTEGQLFGRVRRINERLVYEGKPSDASNAVWQEKFSYDYFDTVQPLGLAADKTQAWALSNRGRDKLALVKVSLETGVETVFFEHSKVDVSGALMSRQTHDPLMAFLDAGYPEIKFFDQKLAARLAPLLAQKPVRFSPFSMSLDTRWMTGAVTTTRGGESVLLDLEQQTTTVLGELTRTRINRVSPLPEQKAISFSSRDGLDLHGYLTLPVGVSAKQLPTVIWVHGGPWARDVWAGDGMVHFLANRGYAVLQINYRGSSGYGRAFRDKAMGEFAGKMHNDIVDGKRWLVEQGIADETKVAIAGASYGGYEALVGLTFTPNEFACGISYVGMSDLASLLTNAPAWWEGGLPFWYKFIGNPAVASERAGMDAKSPLYKAKDATKPLLIMHGVNDPRVKLDQATRMVSALQSAGKPVEFVTFQGDGHGNVKWSNSLMQYRKMEDFLSQCLGGRSGGFDFYQLASWAL
jgi:dipeptidyl aminopeptidase/acylaminoacyl peptidase